MKKKNSEWALDLTINTILVFIGIITIYPIWFTLIASVSSPGAIASGEVLVLPKGLNIDAYKGLLKKEIVWTGYFNSIWYTALGLAINLAAQIPFAFALSRKSLPGRRVVNTFLVIAMYFSGGMIPSYLLISSLGMMNTVWALVIPAAVSGSNVIVARSFMQVNIPEALFDAARIDGCNYTNFFAKIVLPLSKSIIAILSMTSIQSHWNSYMSPMIYLRDRKKWTLQQVVQQLSANLNTALSNLEGEGDLTAVIAKMQESQLMKYSVVVVASAPLVFVYPFVQKHLVKGVMIGSIKG